MSAVFSLLGEIGGEMRSSDDSVAPIIIKRKKIINNSTPHGGAWKVAYADFVTAMMAFFMLMWLLNATTEKQRKGLADYFTPTISINRTSGGGREMFGGDSVLANESLPHQETGITSVQTVKSLGIQGISGLKPGAQNSKASQPSKTKISEQFGFYSLKDLTDTSFIKPSFSVAAVEQVNPEIDPLPQIDLVKTTFQTVLGSEKNHHLIMQQIAPKLIDQLVLRGDGKIEIMLSPKELGKVEFSFQSHDKSGLSIVILAERDETATLVRRHMEVLTKEFERLGYSNIDFSCDGQSDHQKSKSNSAKVSEEIGAANSQDPTAQKAATIAQDYSLSTEVDIRL